MRTFVNLIIYAFELFKVLGGAMDLELVTITKKIEDLVKEDRACINFTKILAKR